MEKIKTKLIYLLVTILFLIVLMSVCFITGIYIQRNKLDDGSGDSKEVTSQIIVDKINDEAFVVSRTIFLDQKAEVVIDKGSGWSNFFWGQTINTEALVRVDLGVDYSKIDEESIDIDSNKKTITIKLPAAEVLDTSVSGDIQVETSNGLFKYLFDNDPNQDHNLATEELIDQAIKAIDEDTELLKDARKDSAKVLELVLKDLGYTIVIE